MTVTFDLWVVIVFLVAFVLLTIHTIFGDLLGKALFNYLKWKEKKERDEKKEEK